MELDPRLQAEVARQPYPLLFVTVSGAHLYGFPSPDSDYDLRGVHILPAREVLGLDAGTETIQVSAVRDGLEVDLVTHDVWKYFTLLLRKNGYVLEQIFSPLIVHAMPEHAELRAIARTCITRHHSHHYLGFAATQWKLFNKEHPRRVKPLLYVYRVLLTGIHLMRTGNVEANLLTLNAEYKLAHIDELVARKLAGPEHSTLPDADIVFHEHENHRLRDELEAAHQASDLPEAPSGKDALNDLLLRLRLATLNMHGLTYFHRASMVDSDALRGTACPVCGLEDAFSEPGGYDICRRCHWEDDPVQREDPDYGGGANRMSINTAREAWREGKHVE